MTTHHCYQHHPMSPSPMDMHQTTCFICTSEFVPSYHSLTCIQCQISLCIDCVLTYTPDTAFPMHLACNAEAGMLKQYRSNPSCATKPYHDPYMMAVYHEYQRFYNTDEYIRLLEEHVENLEHEILCLSQELKNTQNRLSSTKCELLHAKHKKRRSAVVAEETHTE